MPVEFAAAKIVIIDASAAGSLIFGESSARTVAEALSEAVPAGPALLWFELASVCRKKCAFHPEYKTAILAAFELSRRIPIRIVDVDHVKVVQLAEQSGLTTYDACYLWLACELEAALLTLDSRLKKAAAGLGVSTLNSTA